MIFKHIKSSKANARALFGLDLENAGGKPFSLIFRYTVPIRRIPAPKQPIPWRPRPKPGLAAIRKNRPTQYIGQATRRRTTRRHQIDTRRAWRKMRNSAVEGFV
jgi:hypothetical protein